MFVFIELFVPATPAVDRSSFIAPDAPAKSTPSYLNSGEIKRLSEITDPVNQLNVYPGTARYKIMATKEPIIVEQRKEQKKPNKAQIAKEAAKNGGGGANGGGKKPEDDKKERKVNPDDFKQRFKNDPRIKENYETQSDGSLKLRDNAKNPLRYKNGKIIDQIKSDHTHKDIEAYSKKDHLGSLDPVTLEIYKEAEEFRKYVVIGSTTAAALLEETAQAANVPKKKSVGLRLVKLKFLLLQHRRHPRGKEECMAEWYAKREADSSNGSSSYSNYSNGNASTDYRGVYTVNTGPTYNTNTPTSFTPPAFGDIFPSNNQGE